MEAVEWYVLCGWGNGSKIIKYYFRVSLFSTVFQKRSHYVIILTLEVAAGQLAPLAVCCLEDVLKL